MELVSPHKDHEVPQPKCMLGDFLMQAVKRKLDNQGDGFWLTDLSNDQQLRYSELEPLTRRVGSALTRMGFGRQDVMMYVSNNSCLLPAIFLGVWRLNGALGPSYPEDTVETLVGRMTDTECRFIVCDKEVLPSVKEACTRLDWPVNIFCFDAVDGAIPVGTLLEDDGSRFPTKVDYQMDDLVSIVCTGGTTGVSKGAAHTHRSLLNFLTHHNWMLSKVRNGTMLLTVKVFHLGGTIFPALALVRGCHMLLMSISNSDTLTRGLHRYKPSALLGFPTTLMWTVTDPNADKYDYSSVESIMTGGAPISVAQQEKLKEVLPNLQVIHKMYGMTECLIATATFDPLSVTSEDQEVPLHKGTPDNSVGKLVPNMKIKIVDSETQKVLGPDTPGEIWMSGPSLMKEYFKKPEATAETIRDGWIKSGDYGYYDKDGFLYVTDRMKDTFKYWNYHISPVELEEVITKHENVTEACVVGIPDPEGGDTIPRAYVVRKNPNLTEDSLKEYVRARVATYKQLRGGVSFLEELPKSQAGKVSRQQLLLKIKEGIII